MKCDHYLIVHSVFYGLDLRVLNIIGKGQVPCVFIGNGSLTNEAMIWENTLAAAERGDHDQYSDGDDYEDEWG